MQALSYPRVLRASLALAALAVYGVASANSKEYDFSIGTAATSWAINESVPLFSSSLGTLTSVDFYLGGTMITSAELNNQSSNSGATITNNTVGNYGIYGTGTDTSTYFSATSTTYSTTQTLGTGDGTKSYVSPHGVVLSPYTLTFTSTASHATDAATLARFSGTGSLSLMFYASAVSSGTGSVNYNVGNQTTANGCGYVRYNYQPTPEPTSCAALGLGAFAVLRRRKAGAR